MALLLVLAGCDKERPPLEERWTVGVYMAADNNLDPYATKDLDEITRAGVPDNVDLLVYIDRTEPGAWDVQAPNGMDLFPDTRVYAITGSDIEELEQWGEADSSSVSTLRRFAQMVTETGSSRKGLILWNHGGGTVYGSDETNGSGSMNTGEVADALSGALARDQKFDLIGFDACHMSSVSALVDLGPMTEVLIGSPELEPGNGWPYQAVMDAFREGDLDGEAVAEGIVDGYSREYSTSSRSYEPTLVAWRPHAELIPGLDALEQASKDAERDEGDDWWRTVNEAIGDARVYGAPDVGAKARFIEVGDYLEGMSGTAAGAESDALLEDLFAARIAASESLTGADALGLLVTLDPDLRPTVTEGTEFVQGLGRMIDEGEGSAQEIVAQSDTADPAASITGTGFSPLGDFRVLSLDLTASDDTGLATGILGLVRRDTDGLLTVSGLLGVRARGQTSVAAPVGVQLLAFTFSEQATAGDDDEIGTFIGVADFRGAAASFRVGDLVESGFVLITSELEAQGIVVKHDDGRVSVYELEELAAQGVEIAPVRLRVDEANNNAITQVVGTYRPASELTPSVVAFEGAGVEAYLKVTDTAGKVAVDTVVLADVP